MRCKNCGWENAEGVTRCEKCHSVLETRANNGGDMSSSSLNKTVAEPIGEGISAGGGVSCPKCGYPLSADQQSCPNCNYVLPVKNAKASTMCKHCGAENAATAKYCSSCGKALKEERPVSRPPVPGQPNIKGTVLRGPVQSLVQDHNFCTLKPLAWEGENVSYQPTTYSGDVIILNRANTDANNNSITSREQAVLTYENGAWYIENRSDLRTTFLRVNGKVRLSSGDIIVLGNREFEFKG